MATRDDIRHEQIIPDGLTVTITDIEESPRHPREFELTAVDVNGKVLTIVLWKTHNISHDWSEGATYELHGARGKVYSSKIEVHSNTRFRAEPVDPKQEATRLLVFGDTHVGYRHRSSKPSWARTVDNRETFSRCLKRARRLDVDAVVHTGDVFDHENTIEDRGIVEQEIHRTHESGIPFYYIYGNHDDSKGRRALQDTSAIGLGESVAHIGDGGVNLLGVDHSGQEFPDSPPSPIVKSFFDPNILVIHETPYPAVDDGGRLMYERGPNDANIEPFVENLDYDLNLIVCGHMHVAKQLRLKGYEVPVVVTGPTAQISGYKKENRPSTWLVTRMEDGITVERQPL